VDPLARAGFGAADAYDRGRPSYAPAAIDTVVAELALDGSSRVLDLAAGTGQLGRLLLPVVGSVVAAEPSPDMRRVLAERLPEAQVVDGTAEELPVPDASFDAVVVGQAFHWFAAPAALEEIARVLRPGGGLALLWNVQVTRDPDWPLELGELVREHRRAAVPRFPRHSEGRWRDAFLGTDRFAALSSAEALHQHRLDRDGAVAEIASWSFIAALADDEREPVLERVRELVPEASVATLRTEVHWTRAIVTGPSIS
jgi:SAM-dependent methyltransferase